MREASIRSTFYFFPLLLLLLLLLFLFPPFFFFFFSIQITVSRTRFHPWKERLITNQHRLVGLVTALLIEMQRLRPGA